MRSRAEQARSRAEVFTGYGQLYDNWEEREKKATVNSTLTEQKQQTTDGSRGLSRLVSPQTMVLPPTPLFGGIIWGRFTLPGNPEMEKQGVEKGEQLPWLSGELNLPRPHSGAGGSSCSQEPQSRCLTPSRPAPAHLTATQWLTVQAGPQEHEVPSAPGGEELWVGMTS